MRIEISIERLSLQGVPPASARRLSDALARELTRLITDNGLPRALDHDAHCRRLRSPGRMVPATTGARMAKGLARNIYRSLERLDGPNTVPAPAATSPSQAR